MIKEFVAEFLGTFILVITIFTTGQAIPIGAALAVAIYITASISGGHLNPAVSASMLSSGAITTKAFLIYVGAQILGAIAAYLVYKRLLSKEKEGLKI